MITAVFFVSSNILDSQDMRLSALRIPEVLHRLRVAQQILDRHKGLSVDLMGYLGLDEPSFTQNSHLKTLLNSVVQLGLYDRFLKNYVFPHFVAGNSKGDSALNVVAGLTSFEDLVCGSPALQIAPVIPIHQDGGLPVLAGTALAEFHTYQMELGASGDIHFNRLPIPSPHLKDIVQTLVEHHEVERWVNIGPTPAQFNREWKNWDNVYGKVQCVSSIELDPLLSWFGAPLAYPLALAH